MNKKLLCVLLLSWTATLTFAQPGTLDKSYNHKGIKEIIFEQNESNDSVACSILQPDGKLLVVLNGIREYGSFQRTGSLLVRLLANGKPDTSFGLEGKLDLDKVQKGFFGMSIALQNDGKIVLGGHYVNQYNLKIPCLVSLTSDGSKNDLFGHKLSSAVRSGSRVLSELNTYYGYSVRTLEIDQSSGNIFAAASDLNGMAYDFIVASVDRFGDDNNAFDTGDYDTYYLRSYMISDYHTHGIAGSLFHSSSKTLYISTTISNLVGNIDDFTKQFGIIAIDLNTGHLVESFFPSPNYFDAGKKALPISPGRKINECTGMSFSPDSNSIFLSGYAQTDMGTNATDVDYMLYKIKRSGSIDSTFATDGIATYRYPYTPSSFQNFAFSFLVQPNGKMLLGGSVGTGNSFASVMRINANGTVDDAFGTNGYVVYNQNNNETFNSYPGINGIHFYDNKYILLGSVIVNGSYDAFAKRINSNGTNDNSYGTSSNTILYTFGANAVIQDAVATNNGGLWVCGNSQQSFTQKPFVAFINSDGSLGNPGIISLDEHFQNAFLNNPSITAITLYQGKLIIAGTYNQGGMSDLFIMTINTDGTLDLNFSTDGVAVLNLGDGNHYAYDLVIQEGKGILLYAYFNSAASVVRFNFAGERDITFGTNGKYTPPSHFVSFKDTKLQLAVSNGKIFGIATHAAVTQKFLVFRLLEDGLEDPNFGNNGSLGYYTGVTEEGATCSPSSFAVRTDGSIVVGGYRKNNEADFDLVVFLLKADGSGVDSSFNSGGYHVINKRTEEKIETIHLENNNTIVASGTIKTGEGHSQFVLRMDVKGNFDKTINGNGYAVLNEGKLSNSALVNNSLYLVGASSTSTEKGLVTKVRLGAGVPVKPTVLALANFNKTYGDAPFKIQAVTNSPAPIVYSIVQSQCATIDPKTGWVTITCATVDSETPIIVRATQSASNGFTAATATSTIYVEKAFPKIFFPVQGAITGTKFKLQAYSESSLQGGYFYFNQETGFDVVHYDYYTDSMEAIMEGEAQIAVYFYETRDFREASKTTTIYIYDSPVPPVANRDEAEFDFGTAYAMEINILNNDEAYTGTIATSSTDLDPSTPGIQNSYTSPALGLFIADTNGIVTYTPFSGFIGSGEITYTITDSKNQVSEPAAIHVSVVTKSQPPALKATELITPNNDGLNEAFVIGYINLEQENLLKIFDRNGQELATFNNYRNDWRGELSNGQQAENGIYYYVFKEGNGDNSRELKGVVELRK